MGWMVLVHSSSERKKILSLRDSRNNKSFFEKDFLRFFLSTMWSVTSMTAKLSVVFRLLCVVKDTRIRFFSYLALLKFSNYVSFLSFFCFYTSINAQSLIPVHTVQKKIFLFDNYNEFQAWFDTKLSLEGEVFFILTKSFKDHALSDSLVFAKHRGVNVQILMPHKATNELDSQFSRFKIFHINLGLHNGSFI